MVKPLQVPSAFTNPQIYDNDVSTFGVLQRQIWPGVLRWKFLGSLNVPTCVTHVVEKTYPQANAS